MSCDAVEALARTLLYEGCLLYPYRRDSLKNRHRFHFGGLYPAEWCVRDGADRALARVQCLVRGRAPRLRVEARFLRFGRSAELEQHALECRVPLFDAAVSSLCDEPHRFRWELPARDSELQLKSLAARAAARAWPVEAPDAFRVEIEVENLTRAVLPQGSGRYEHALSWTLGALHLVLWVESGRFCSLLEPEPELVAEAERAEQLGLFPVLVGNPRDASTLLASPIVLYDYPRIAPESHGDLFDATEIDEILSLRILTLTEAEKADLRRDPRARELLERTEALDAAALLQLHGARRRGGLESICVSGQALSPGDRVRLRPVRRADAFDLALVDRAARVEALEVDLEGRVSIAVTIEDDPGADLGRAGMPGHRFFFSPEEVEVLP